MIDFRATGFRKLHKSVLSRAVLFDWSRDMQQIARSEISKSCIAVYD